MSSSEGINLRNSLLGFVGVHKDILYVKEHNILIRDDDEFKNDKKSVLIISGGGSGHEPFSVGYIGKGMLSAAICGDIFTSPSATSCLASILLSSQNDPNREILMIINNYTGDRLNFGLAIEMARNIHKYKNIKSIIIDDDCAIDKPPNSTGRRGLTGIGIIIKIAGAMSAKGLSMCDIYEKCSSILNNRLIRTIGFTFQHNINELNQIDIGYGIHGEPGILKLDNAKCFNSIIDILKKKLKLDDVIESDMIVLFNNLGGASEFIFYNFIKNFMDSIDSFKVARIYAGKFLTSLGKEGIGVSIMEMKDNSIIELLEYPIDTPVDHLFNFPLKYSHCTREMDFEVRNVSEGGQDNVNVSKKINSSEIENVKEILMKVCHDLNDAREDLNNMDKELGDNDTGETFSRAANELLKELKKNNLNIENPHKFLITVSDILMRSMGGSSGAIFSIFFQCASIAFSHNNEYSLSNWLQALLNGIEGIMQHGKAEIGDRTLLDSLNVGYTEMKEIFNDVKSIEAVAGAFEHGCKVGVEQTKTMRPRSGRSAYSMADKETDYKFSSKFPDPGAYAISIIASGIFSVLQGRGK